MLGIPTFERRVMRFPLWTLHLVLPRMKKRSRHSIYRAKVYRAVIMIKFYPVGKLGIYPGGIITSSDQVLQGT